MATCSGCNATLGCSCNKRVASDGSSRCNNCIINYERKLSGLPPTTVLNRQTPTNPAVPNPTQPILPGRTYQHNFQQITAPIITGVTVRQGH